MESIKHNATSPAALTILSDFALANIIFAAYKLGFFEQLKHIDSKNTIDLKKIKNVTDMNPRTVKGISDYLVARDVLIPTDIVDSYTLGGLGEHLINDGWISYIAYYVGGYGNLLNKTDEIATGNLNYGIDIVRNIDWVAIGTELMSVTKHHSSYNSVILSAKRNQCNSVLDIGCGTAKFLAQLVKSSNASLGVGIDISAEACKLANDSVNTNEDFKKIAIYEGDFEENVGNLETKFGKFDIITAMMIIHEYLFQGDDKVINVLKGISNLLTEGGTFILLDKATDSLVNHPLYFTEFKLAHDLSNQDLCSFEKWEYLITSSNLRIKNFEKLPPHTGTVLFECERVV